MRPIVTFFLLLGFSLNTLPAQPLPIDLPPGVSILPPDAKQSPPLGYTAQLLEIDWSNPLLACKLINYTDNPTPAPDLARLEETNSEPLRIQLIEPANANEPNGGTPLPLFIPSDSDPIPRSPNFANQPFIAISQLSNWLPTPTPANSTPGEISPLSLLSNRAAVRWLGHPSALDDLPSLDFEAFCLLSITRPADHITRFAIIQRTTSGVGRIGEVRRWLKAIAAPDDWIAIHSIGPQAWVGVKGWRLTAEGDTRIAKRAGGVLELQTKKSGDPVDWLRLPSVRLKSSEYEAPFRAEQAIGASLIPHLLSPRAWISVPVEKRAAPPWLEATFDRPRPIDRINLIWPEAAGWSHQFNPAKVTLQIAPENQEEPHTVQIIEPNSAITSWPPDDSKQNQTQTIHRIRIIFNEPSQLPGDNRARLAALQAWGPYENK